MNNKVQGRLLIWGFVLLSVVVCVHCSAGFMYLERSETFVSPFAGKRDPNEALTEQRKQTILDYLSKSDDDDYNYDDDGDAQTLAQIVSFVKSHTNPTEEQTLKISKSSNENSAKNVNSANNNNNKNKNRGRGSFAKDIRGGKELSEFSAQFVGIDGIEIDLSRQIEGDYRGGLIPFYSLWWEYGARDISEVRYENETLHSKRSFGFRSNFFGTQSDGPLCIRKMIDRATVPLFAAALGNDEAANNASFCPPPQPVNAVLEVPLNYLSNDESLIFFLSGAVVSSFSIGLPENQEQNFFEEVCFDYPMILMSYVNSGRTKAFTNLAHSCHTTYCLKYPCVCETTLFGNSTWNLVPRFCPLSTFYKT